MGVRKVRFTQKTEFNNLILDIPMKINSKYLSEAVARDYIGNCDFQGKKIYRRNKRNKLKD